MAPDDKSYNEQRRAFYAGEIADALSLKNIVNDIDDAHLSMEEGARRLNELFGQNRQRITEIKTAIANTVPEITKLGGDIQDVYTTLEGISEATQRNIIASKEDASQLFAASKILKTPVESLVHNFTEAGIQVSRIGPELERSINPIQNLGLNVKQIMGEVIRNLDKLSQYSFASGVEGLAKMASHASMFKFDMSDTFRIADKALKPEGAIELASAFQRMGVAVGELTDPFKLMNTSLTNPEGLQKSLSQMTKQYAEFDEKTKTFKISPAGMLQMRELKDQTDITYKSLADSAIAMANLDRAMTQLKDPNIKIANEEDRELLANVATMDAEGNYEIKLKNELTGRDDTIKLADLTKEQFDKFIQQQKTAPKTLEQIEKASLDTLNDIAVSLRAGKEGTVYGATSEPRILNLVENVNSFLRDAAEKVPKYLPNAPEAREKTTTLINDFTDGIKSLYKDYQEGRLTKEKLEEKAREAENKTLELGKKIGQKSTEYISDVIKNFDDRFIKNNPLTSTRTASQKEAAKKSEVDLNFKGGIVTHNVNITPNVDNDFVTKLFQNQTFQNEFLSSLLNADPVTKAKIKQALGF